MKYKFSTHERVFANSQEKIKEYWLYSNKGKWQNVSCYMGAVVFYKDNTIKFVSGGGDFSLEEVNYISKKFKSLVKKSLQVEQNVL